MKSIHRLAAAALTIVPALSACDNKDSHKRAGIQKGARAGVEKIYAAGELEAKERQRLLNPPENFDNVPSKKEAKGKVGPVRYEFDSESGELAMVTESQSHYDEQEGTISTNGVRYFVRTKNGKSAVMKIVKEANRSDEMPKFKIQEVTPFIYDKIETVFNYEDTYNNHLAIVKKGGKSGVVDIRNGRVLVPIIYDEIDAERGVPGSSGNTPDGFVRATKGQKTTLVPWYQGRRR